MMSRVWNINIKRQHKILLKIYFYNEKEQYLHYLHFSDYRPHLCRHVYHNGPAVARSGLFQVIGTANLTLYLAYQGRLF